MLIELVEKRMGKIKWDRVSRYVVYKMSICTEPKHQSKFLSMG